VEGASDVVAALTPADILLFVDVLDAGAARELTVHAESSPRYVVRAIVPAAVRVGGRVRP
jgi:hypothetical protein